MRVPLLAITRDQEWYEAQLEVLRDCRQLLRKLVASQNGEAEDSKGSDDKHE